MRLERSSALARIGEKLQRAIDEAKALAEQLGGEPPGTTRDALLERHREARRRAEEYRFYLVVQREALGMRDQKIVDEIYPMPPPVR